MLIAAGFRLYRMHDECLWLDEYLSYHFLDAGSLDAFLEQIRTSNAPTTPLYFCIEYAWARWVSGGEYGLRLLSVAIGVGSIALVYALGQHCIGRYGGFCAALYLALSPRAAYYDQEIRMYTLVVLMALLSVYTLWRAIREDKTHWLVLHAAANICLLWSHLFGAFLLVAEGLWLLAFHRRPFAPVLAWGIVQIPIVASAVWYMETMNVHIVGQSMSWLGRPVFLDLVRLLLQPASRGPSIYAMSGRFEIGASAMIAVFGIGVLIHGIRTRRAPARTAFMGLLLLWWAAPPCLLFLESVVGRPAQVPRYTLYAAPPVFLLAAQLGALLPRGYRALAAAACVAALLAMQYDAPRPWRADWRSAAAAIQQHAAPHAAVFAGLDTDTLAASIYFPAEARDKLFSARTPKEIGHAIAFRVQRDKEVWAARFAPWSVASQGVRDRLPKARPGLRVDRFDTANPDVKVLRYRFDEGTRKRVESKGP